MTRVPQSKHGMKSQKTQHLNGRPKNLQNVHKNLKPMATLIANQNGNTWNRNLIVLIFWEMWLAKNHLDVEGVKLVLISNVHAIKNPLCLSLGIPPW